MKKIFISIAIMFLVASSAFAAGSVTQTFEAFGGGGANNNGGIYVLTFSWTGDSSNGSVPATITDGAITQYIKGKYVVAVVTNPGSTAPTDDYDITLTDADGVDVMGGSLADRDTTNTEQALPYVGTAYSPRPIAGALTLNITNQNVHSATGTVVIYLSR